MAKLTHRSISNYIYPARSIVTEASNLIHCVADRHIMVCMVSKSLYSSAKEDWGTPQELFDRLQALYNFELDAAASDFNAKCDKYFSKADDALAQDWAQHKRIWLNPPYGREIGKWMQKAYEESLRGSIVVCLVHARTDTRWWHDWVEGKGRVTFLKGRLKFTRGEDAQISGSAPFPSVLIVYDPHLYSLIHAPPGINGRTSDGAGCLADCSSVRAFSGTPN